MKITTTEIARRTPIIQRVLFLDGLTRAGKFLLGKVVSNIKRVEFYQYVPILEHLPYLHSLGVIRTDAAVSMMQLYTDLSVYEMGIGRCLNTRESDSSSILNSTEKEVYLNRSKGPADWSAVESLIDGGRIPSYLVHECFPLVDLFFEAFPQLLMISIQRHPVDIAHSWFLRGWGERIGKDPLSFVPALKGNTTEIPWFAAEWLDDYERYCPADRVVRSICTLSRRTVEKLGSLPHDKRRHVLMVAYEDLFLKPDSVIEKFCEFLDSEPFLNMQEIFAREGLPKAFSLNEREKKFNELKALADDRLISDLLQCSTEYEETWGLAPFI